MKFGWRLTGFGSSSFGLQVFVYNRSVCGSLTPEGVGVSLAVGGLYGVQLHPVTE